MNYDLMPLVERKALLGALLQAYIKGGDQLVEGQQMTRGQIVAEMKALKASIEQTNAVLAQIKK